MPESEPDIFLNKEGICNICLTYEHEKQDDNKEKLLESDLLKILDKYKGKKKYDCMVMCSGGKDSTSALYFMKTRYNLNILAFMFDHGFETKEAIDNVRNAVDILDVDFILYKSSFMKPMFSKILQTDSKATLCHICSIWYMDLAYDVAARYDIPLIVAGWTKGQSQTKKANTQSNKNHYTEFLLMSEATECFLNNQLKDMPQYKRFPKSMEEVLKRAKKRHKSLVISPHWFLPYGPEEYVKIIKQELGWKAPALSYPKGSTNCLLNFISVYNSIKHFGYTHYHVEASKLIRKGVISREEAIEQLKQNFDFETLNKVASKMNISFDDSL
ncbi:MAG: 7-cyano-7-deazaguanine synthase [Bacteroidales bacterium]|nr:7-cyano-7-deazaguanine synthase [Bacteroidales bacterium]MDD4216328.1 7-cyano-7-deazaguanine synthase [Bacteroidales bacterium]MDY0140877.1 7-cyano-7-deazaguanine synthase [Bacteroidales bacterium]